MITNYNVFILETLINAKREDGKRGLHISEILCNAAFKNGNVAMIADSKTTAKVRSAINRLLALGLITPPTKEDNRFTLPFYNR